MCVRERGGGQDFELRECVVVVERGEFGGEGRVWVSGWWRWLLLLCAPVVQQ